MRVLFVVAVVGFLAASVSADSQENPFKDVKLPDAPAVFGMTLEKLGGKAEELPGHHSLKKHNVRLYSGTGHRNFFGGLREGKIVRIVGSYGWNADKVLAIYETSGAVKNLSKGKDAIRFQLESGNIVVDVSLFDQGNSNDQMAYFDYVYEITPANFYLAYHSDTPDDIKKAMRAYRPAQGMSVEQATAALGEPAEHKGNTVWPMYLVRKGQAAPHKSRAWHCVVEDGKIVRARSGPIVQASDG